MCVIRSQCKNDEEFISALRDEIAAKAMQGLIFHEEKALPFSARNCDDFDTRVAYSAYRYADAMLKEREK